MAREMSRLREWIEQMAEGEPIEGVLIGRMGWPEDYGSEGIPGYDTHPRDRVLPWDEAAPLVNYEFHAGFGAPRCEAVYAWTPSWVIFVSQYDGATAPQRIPRHPRADVPPEMPGG